MTSKRKRKSVSTPLNTCGFYYLVEERQVVPQRKHFSQSFSEVPEVTRRNVVDEDCSRTIINQRLHQRQEVKHPNQRVNKRTQTQTTALLVTHTYVGMYGWI